MESRIHYGTIDSSSKLFHTEEQALLALEAINKKCERLCRTNNINCIFLGIVSSSSHNGVKQSRYGKRIPKSHGTIEPHIHITYIAEKQSTFEKLIKGYLQKKFGKDLFFYQTIKSKKHFISRFPYSFNQCTKLRIVNTCTEDFAKLYCGDFVFYCEKANKKIEGREPVFPQYQNMTLSSDKSVFDFSYGTNFNSISIDTKILNETYKNFYNDDYIFSIKISQLDDYEFIN